MPLKPITVHLPEDDLERAHQKAEALKRFREILSAGWEEPDLTEEKKEAVRLAREARKRLAAQRRKTL